MTFKLEVGKAYRDTGADWLAAMDARHLGDLIERWIGGLGRRLVWTSQRADDGVWTEFTVLELAPRGPSWAGAQLVIDRDGDAWWLDEGPSNYWHDCPMKASDLEADYGPCLPLIDAKGLVVIDTVLKINKVTRADLGIVVMGNRVVNARPQDTADRVLDALAGGGR